MVMPAAIPGDRLLIRAASGSTISTSSAPRRPLPFSEPERLVWVAERNDKLELPTFAASALNYLSWRDETRTLEPMGARSGSRAST